VWNSAKGDEMSQKVFDKIMVNCYGTDFFFLSKDDVSHQCRLWRQDGEEISKEEENAAIKWLEQYHSELPKFRLEFDNGGGTTLELGDWIHYYGTPEWAAHDLAAYLRTGNTDGWDNSSPALSISGHPSSVIFDEIADIHNVDLDVDHPANVLDFVTAWLLEY
jgi:hypothetical protein